MKVLVTGSSGRLGPYVLAASATGAGVAEVAGTSDCLERSEVWRLPLRGRG